MKPASLNTVLGLRPLDRLQINDAREIQEMQFAPQLGYGTLDLPFFYFQRTLEDGRLEVCSPSGYVTAVRPEDVCDIVRGEPVMVRAMPHDVFVARLKLPYSGHRDQAGPECFADAYVLRVFKDKWGRVDQVEVSFVDSKLNIGKSWNAPLAPGERDRLTALATRSVMPVSGKGSRGASCTADQGIADARNTARQTVRRFLGCAVQGHREGVETLALVGAKKISRAALNKLPVLATALWN